MTSPAVTCSLCQSRRECAVFAIHFPPLSQDLVDSAPSELVTSSSQCLDEGPAGLCHNILCCACTH